MRINPTIIMRIIFIYMRINPTLYKINLIYMRIHPSYIGINPGLYVYI